MKSNKFIALVAILSQLTGISVKAADTPKVSSDSVKTAESKKSKNPNKQKKRKKENRNDVSSEGGYENLYPYGFWGLHETLSLCGGDSWWKYPSYLSVLKNCGRLFSSGEDESMDTQLKKMEQQAAELKKQEADKIKEKFGQDVNVEKIKKIQTKYKQHYFKLKENARNSKLRSLVEIDNRCELTSEMSLLKNVLDSGDIVSDIIKKQNINIKDLKNEFKSKYSENPKNSYIIYDVVDVENEKIKEILINELNELKNDEKVKAKSKNSAKVLTKHLNNNDLRFFLIFSSASDCSGRLFVSLACCRNLSFADNFIKSEAKNVKNPSGSNPFWGMFIGPYNRPFLECDINKIKNDEDENGGNESDESSENKGNEDEDDD